MKTLYLLRHAKSNWGDPSLSDRERPLNARGERDAPRMGAALGERYAPMTFYVSPAERAQATFAGMQSGWPELQIAQGITTAALYTFDYQRLLDWIANRRDDPSSLALIGHNPALTELIHFFVGSRSIDNLPTAGWVQLSIDLTSWAEVNNARGQGKLVYCLLPRTLREAS